MARGDHIAVRRLRGYVHHGIDCGDGTVIHYAGANGDKRTPMIARTPYAGFAKGGRVRTVLRAAEHEAEEIVARAESRLGETRYHLLTGNCEHFAMACARGQSTQTGLERLVDVAAGCATAALVAGAVLALPFQMFRR